MPNTYTEQVFRSTYKDDFKDSDNYHRILFNSGRALQARELTQMQTIIQKEIDRFGSNVFKEGALVQAGGYTVNNKYKFVKIEGSSQDIDIFDDVDAIRNSTFTGATNGIKIRVDKAVAAVDSDPNTFYVQYLDVPEAASGATATKLQAGESITGTVGSRSVTLQVQSEDTTTNPATGVGTIVSCAAGSFFTQGHFVFLPAQELIVDKYSPSANGKIGFKVVQDIVTVSDTDDLYDNQGVTPNKSSPGADRYRIRLVMTKESDLAANDTFIFYLELRLGKVQIAKTASEDYNYIHEFVAKRIEEINGDFIKKYFTASFQNENSTQLALTVSPGTAYIRGNRINKDTSSLLTVKKPTQTIDVDGEQVGLDYGNYYEFDSGKGMLDFSTCQKVYLKQNFNGGGLTVATANIRAITEGSGNKYRAYIFNLKDTEENQISLRNVKSISSDSASGTDYINLVLSNGISTLNEPKKTALIYDTPIRRPKDYDNITLTVQDKKSFTATSPTQTVEMFPSGQSSYRQLVNETDAIVSSADSFPASGVGVSKVSDYQFELSGLDSGQTYDVRFLSKLTNQDVKPKTLIETTVTTTFDSDGKGVRYINLGKSDIYSIKGVKIGDSDGENVFTHFSFDPGSREAFYGDGSLTYLPTSTREIAADSDVFVRFEYFSRPSTQGAFYAANSYLGQVDYGKIPNQKLSSGNKINLRDVIDFRPSTDGSGNFTDVIPLPIPTESVVINDAEYYLPRNDKLVLSKGGELRYINGTPSLTPKFPQTPIDCIDLYKFELNPNTLHEKDLKSTIIPKRGYTMEDINKIETRLDKLEELTTLSMLEVATNNLKVLDSAGLERTKSGFFVDNFSTQKYSATKSVEYRASIDPRDKLLRPSHKTDAIELGFDSAHEYTNGVVRKGDYLMLDHSEVLHFSQTIASKTENLQPLLVSETIGNLEITPSTDYWKETEVSAPLVIDGGTQLDVTQALLWNEHEWGWKGIDINDLQIGDTTSAQTLTSTSTTVDVEEPVLKSVDVDIDVSDWTVTGTTVDFDSADTQIIYDNILKSSTYEAYSQVNSNDDWKYLGDNWTDVPRDPNSLYAYQLFEQVQYETITPVTVTTTTDKSQTITLTTNNNYETKSTTTNTTNTTTTVNRVASESTLREVIGTKIVDTLIIPWMRSRRIFFKADGLRPKSVYFPFFGGSNVSRYCREEVSYEYLARRNELEDETYAEGLAQPTEEHSQGSTALEADTNGRIIGSFEIPNNVYGRFPTGTLEFALLDISKYDLDNALSYAITSYTSAGTVDTVQDTVRSTRVLKIVGDRTETTSIDVQHEVTPSTNSVITEVISTDVDVSTTETEVSGTKDTTTLLDEDQGLYWDVTPMNPPATDSRGRCWNSQTRTYNFAWCPSVDGGDDGGDDPVAQTVYNSENNGYFITKVRVYFSTKDDVHPVGCEIRPVENGVPSASKVIASTWLTPDQVTTVPAEYQTADGILSYGTDFEFEEPVFIAGRTEYAITLMPGVSTKYNVFISEVEDFVLGSTEKRITKQPTLGSFFKSQNSRVWEPVQTQDLTFQVYRAEFDLNGAGILHNAVPPWTKTQFDPIQLTKGSSTVRVFRRGHGLRVNDYVKVDCNQTHWDTKETEYGPSYADITGTKQVTAADGNSFAYDCGTNAKVDRRVGAGQVVFSPNYSFSVVKPVIDITQPETTNVTLSAKFTTGTSHAGSETAYVKDTAFKLIKNEQNTNFTAPRLVCNKINQTNLMSGEYPLDVQLAMSTTDSRVSPVVDLQRCGMYTIQNIIDRQDSAGGDGFNQPYIYIPETHPTGGSALAKHVTIPMEMEQDAVGLKVLVAANKPPQAEFEMYYRVSDANTALTTRPWTLISPDNTLPSDVNKNTFREYRYLVGGLNGTMKPFTKFQLKIVMKSQNASQVPMFRDLRAMALAV